jgi:hypothetical protein
MQMGSTIVVGKGFEEAAGIHMKVASVDQVIHRKVASASLAIHRKVVFAALGAAKTEAARSYAGVAA